MLPSQKDCQDGSGASAAGRPPTAARSCWPGSASPLSLGVLAPRAEHALSGGGWQADGSESVEARAADRPALRRAGQLCAGRGRQLADARRREPGLPRDDRPGGRPAAARPGRRSGAVAPAHRSAERASRRRVRRCGRRHGRHGARRGSPSRSPRGGRRAGSRGIADRVRRPVVGVQRGEQGRDAALGGDVLAGHLGRARRRLRLARRGRDPAAARDPRARRHRRRALDRSASHRHHDLGDELRADVRARGGDRLRALRRGSLPGRAARGPAPGRRGRRDDGQRRQGGARQRRRRAGLAGRRHDRAEPAVPHERARDPARRGLRARCFADPAAGTAGAPRPSHRPLRAALGGRCAAPQRGVCALGPPDLAPADRDRRAGARGARPARRDRARPAHGHADDRRPALRRERASRLRAASGRVRSRGARRAPGGGAEERVPAGARRARAQPRRGGRGAARAARRPRADASTPRLRAESDVVERVRSTLPDGALVGGAAAEGARSRARTRSPASARLRPGGRGGLRASAARSSAHRSPPRWRC